MQDTEFVAAMPIAVRALCSAAFIVLTPIAAPAQSGSDAAPAPVLQLPAPQDDASPITLRGDDPRAPLFSAAQVYASYHEEVDWAGRREIVSSRDLDETMDALAAYYDDETLADAQLAYAALIATEHPEFIDSVRAVADYYGVDAARAGLMDDTLFVTGFPGAREAGRSVREALDADAEELRAVSDRYRLAAYNLQSQAWARRRNRDRSDRLAALEAASDRLRVNFEAPDPAELHARFAPAQGGIGSASALYEGGVSEGPSGPMSAPDLVLNVGEVQLTPDERRVGRILSVAALQAVQSADPAAIDRLLEDPAAQRCIAWARLDLAQCVAAGQFKYEDSFCIAEHALNDIATCLSVMRAGRPRAPAVPSVSPGGR